MGPMSAKGALARSPDQPKAPQRTSYGYRCLLAWSSRKARRLCFVLPNRATPTSTTRIPVSTSGTAAGRSVFTTVLSGSIAHAQRTHK
jgi:hypothetical protein